MARIINGQNADDPESKRKAVESAGGTYNQYVQGNYVQGRSRSKQPTQKQASSNSQPRNYFEKIGGKRVECWEDELDFSEELNDLDFED